MTKMKILFVDDDRYEMYGLIERLEAADYTVEPVTSTVIAIQKIESGFLPDLIISDLIMPAVPDDASPLSNRHVGIEFCRMMKEQFKLRCPIIVLTVVTDPVIQQEAKKYAQALLVKPITPSDLLRRVEEVLKS
jgi:two-component system chemotaxis response regulator CheY